MDNNFFMYRLFVKIMLQNYIKIPGIAKIDMNYPD